MPSPMTTRRAAAIAALAATFIAPWEGNDPVARHQAIDPIGVITWCHGRTNYDDPTVKVGTRFTKAQCDAFLVKDIPKYLGPVRKCVHADLTNHQWASLASVSYNTGAGATCKSPMVAAFNKHDPRACDYFVGWHVRANGKFLQGLANRREAERRLCKTPD